MPLFSSKKVRDFIEPVARLLLETTYLLAGLEQRCNQIVIENAHLSSERVLWGVD
jgi:hypothetical protein